ncbi:MAG: hypothetical protein AAF639_18510 [Chloroflexota bacterium]
MRNFMTKGKSQRTLGDALYLYHTYIDSFARFTINIDSTTRNSLAQKFKLLGRQISDTDNTSVTLDTLLSNIDPVLENTIMKLLYGAYDQIYTIMKDSLKRMGMYKPGELKSQSEPKEYSVDEMQEWYKEHW